MLFVIASISMQRKQLDMQQDELKMQREELAKTREEFELTNKTLTKQQFESTFFNMINLHHNLLKDLDGGRTFFENTYHTLWSEYVHAVEKHWAVNLIWLKNHDTHRLKLLLRTIYLNDFKINNLMSELKSYNPSRLNQNLIKEIETKNDNYIKNSLDEISAAFENMKIDDFFKECMSNPHLLSYLLDKDSNRFFYYPANVEFEYNYSNVRFIEEFNDEWTIDFMKQLRKETLIEPLFQLKKLVYENIYKEKEEQIGHYYRNLYRIMKFIQDEHFSNNFKENEKEKKKYRGILRAQLSSMELLMLFYNVVYSEKGQKFKAILKGTNFFDDHLIESKFLWANDKEELAALK